MFFQLAGCDLLLLAAAAPVCSCGALKCDSLLQLTKKMVSVCCNVINLRPFKCSLNRDRNAHCLVTYDRLPSNLWGQQAPARYEIENGLLQVVTVAA